MDQSETQTIKDNISNKTRIIGYVYFQILPTSEIYYQPYLFESLKKCPRTCKKKIK